jgi:hypothetical protein
MAHPAAGGRPGARCGRLIVSGEGCAVDDSADARDFRLRHRVFKFGFRDIGEAFPFRGALF